MVTPLACVKILTRDSYKFMSVPNSKHFKHPSSYRSGIARVAKVAVGAGMHIHWYRCRKHLGHLVTPLAICSNDTICSHSK